MIRGQRSRAPIVETHRLRYVLITFTNYVTYLLRSPMSLRGDEGLVERNRVYEFGSCSTSDQRPSNQMLLAGKLLVFVGILFRGHIIKDVTSDITRERVSKITLFKNGPLRVSPWFRLWPCDGIGRRTWLCTYRIVFFFCARAVTLCTARSGIHSCLA